MPVNKVEVNGKPLIDLTTNTIIESHVLDGDKFHDKSGAAKTGTMVNNGNVAPTALNAGGSYTIPAGYHAGAGKVTTNTLASQTSATADANDIRKGKTAYMNGSEITGTLPFYNNITGGVNIEEIVVSSTSVGIRKAPFTQDGIINANAVISYGMSNTSLVSKLGITANQIASESTILGLSGTYEGQRVVKKYTGELTSGQTTVSLTEISSGIRKPIFFYVQCLSSCYIGVSKMAGPFYDQLLLIADQTSSNWFVFSRSGRSSFPTLTTNQPGLSSLTKIESTGPWQYVDKDLVIGKFLAYSASGTASNKTHYETTVIVCGA